MKKRFSVLMVATALMFSIVAGDRVSAQAALTAGQVTKIDPSAGKITIKHGPMKKFDMDDGMTMVYRVKDAAMLTAVKPGDKIKFDADHVNGQFIVTKIEKVK